MRNSIRARIADIRRVVIYALMKIVSVFVKKNDNIWLFGERNGLEFSNNSKYLYLYVKEHQEHVRPIWLTRSTDIFDEIQRLGGEVYFIHSIKAIYFGLKARVYVHSHGRFDITNYTKRGSIFINLYHGMPIKTLPSKYWYDDLDIATSEATRKTRFESFHIDNVVITGEPRYDILFRETNRFDTLKKYSLERFSGKTLVTYLPTFRESPAGYRALFSNSNAVGSLANAVIIEKSHFVERGTASDVHGDSENVVNISQQYVDTQELLSITDILITDYSACMIDFLLTDRPIILYPYDLREYRESRGFFYDYDEICPGLVAYTEQDVLEAIKVYLADPQFEAEKRKQVKAMFHKYQDGSSSDRVYREIVKLIAKKHSGHHPTRPQQPDRKVTQ